MISNASWVFLAMFILTFILNIPMPLGFFSATVFCLMIKGISVGSAMGQIINGLYDGYVLIAIPLFIFSARIMNEGKITEKIFNFARALVARLPGGMGHVNILASLIFSGMSGSALSDAAGLGLMEIEEMRKDGYDDGFSCAITMTSATIGPIFPPSIPMVMFAMLAGTSVGALFAGGMVPGILMAIGLMIYILIVAKKRNYPKGINFTLKELIRSTFQALPALFTPLILLGGIYTGFVTPTEAGALAGFYAILVSIIFYKSLTWKKMVDILKDTIVDVGIISFLIGTTYCISFVISNENIPKMIANAFLNQHWSPLAFFFTVDVALLILGMFINTSTIQLVFFPIFIPIAKMLGINVIQFGVTTTLVLMLGLSTPPYGTMLFMVSGLAKVPLGVIIKELMPQIGVLIIIVIILTLFPDVILFLPRLMGLI